MPLEGKESTMAKNIMDFMEEAGLDPRASAALGEKVWTAISKGIIKTINDEGLVEVKGGGSYGGEMAKIK
ncbi:hypothetical protein [Vibrio parahaemolyticus]|uniref:hypothetical protein n=1 Tax=Vibrio parahaemolyticus TaxID=670 RepID=UPI000649DB79|nr:hypothetical protein [Vibrio parahaemolyticus]EII3125339.1 hypothetical protein [Vibrio parahaemolyticus]KOH04521.1 hypothetical protein ACZ98_23355 [Vibrio parahaemolyticus]